MGRASPLPQCAQATSLRQPTLLTFVRRHFCVDATFVSLSSPARLLLFGRLRLELASGDVELLPQTISDGSRIDKGPFKWLRGVLAPDGHVYCIPACADYVLRISADGTQTALGREARFAHKPHTSLSHASHKSLTRLTHKSHTPTVFPRHHPILLQNK